MRTVYLVAAVLVILLGLVHIAATFRLFDGLNSRAIWFASGGLAIVLTGLLNLLNRTYGAAAPGLRWSTVGATATMTLFAGLAGVAGAAPAAQIAFIMGLMVATTLLALRPRPA